MKRLINVIIFVCILAVTTVVQAVNIEELNMQIDLPEDYTKIVQLENIEEFELKRYYEENHIYLNAANEEKNKSILIANQENELTNKIGDFGKLEEADQEIFIGKYNKTKKENNQVIKKQEKVKYKEVTYLHTVFEQVNGESKVIVEEYYTIVEKSAYIISASYQNVENNEEEMRQVITSLKFNESQVKSNNQFFYTYIIMGVLIVLVILYFIKIKREKPVIDEKEKSKIINEVKEYMIQKTKYEKFGGYLVVFYITVILNIINLFFSTFEYFTNNIFYEGIEIKEIIYFVTAIMQNVIGLLGMVYIWTKIKKKEVKSLEKIKKVLYIILISTIFLTIIRFITQASIYKLGVFETIYIQTEIKVFLQSFTYLFVWIMYLKNSIRTSIYYNNKTLEEIILSPVTAWQKHIVNKKIMEFKLIDYFRKQKAFDYQSGIYINKLPKEYAGSLSLSDLNTKKIIRLKKAKYYLSNEALNDPNIEKKQALKIGVWVIVISILYLMLVTTI